MMSATAVANILSVFRARNTGQNKYFVVEYGSGNSTKFFVEYLAREHIAAHYIAVERSPEWYEKIRALFPGGMLVKRYWTLSEYVAYARATPQNAWPLGEGCGRLATIQKKMLSPRSLATLFFRKRRFWFDARYETGLGSVRFDYRYIYEGFKDQFGESPHKFHYIRLPLVPLLDALQGGGACHAIFIIDGGPRADVVKEILDLIDQYKNLAVDIFLLEAYRGYYEPALSSRPGGRFIAAERNEMVDGRPYLAHDAPRRMSFSCAALLDAPSVDEALARELWHFTNVSL